MARKMPIHLILIIAILISGCFFRRSAEQVTAETDKQIERSESLQRLEKMCRDLPVFSSISPGKKTIGRYGNRLTFYYRLDRDFNEIKAAYKNKFLNEGWTLIEEKSLVTEDLIEFEKATLRVYAANGLYGNENYAVDCQDKSISDERSREPKNKTVIEAEATN